MFISFSSAPSIEPCIAKVKAEGKTHSPVGWNDMECSEMESGMHWNERHPADHVGGQPI